jgi:hypothetical protein
VSCFVLSAGPAPPNVTLHVASMAASHDAVTWSSTVLPPLPTDGSVPRAVYVGVVGPCCPCWMAFGAPSPLPQLLYLALFRRHLRRWRSARARKCGFHRFFPPPPSIVFPPHSYGSTLPSPGSDFMWYLEAELEGGEVLYFPPTAPAAPQHVVLM